MTESTRAITFEKDVDCLGENFKVKRLKGTTIDPPAIPDIDPIPDRSDIEKIPKISKSTRLPEFDRNCATQSIPPEIGNNLLSHILADEQKYFFELQSESTLHFC